MLCLLYIVCRQLDTNVLLILVEKLNISHPLPVECIGEAMGLLEFRFILTDVVRKIESVVGIQKCQTEEPLQYIANPEYFMCDISNFIKYINRNMKKVRNVYSEKGSADKTDKYLTIVPFSCIHS